MLEKGLIFTENNVIMLPICNYFYKFIISHMYCGSWNSPRTIAKNAFLASRHYKRSFSMKRSLGKSVTKKIVSVAIAAALILSVATTGVLTTSASDSTGVGLSAHALQAYNEHWSYVWGGASYGAVDCSGLFITYNGVGGNRTDLLGSSSEWGYVADGIPRIHGLGLHQPYHVGIYIGSGTAIDARDENSGVVYHDVYSKPWVEWFKVAGVSYPTTGWVLFDGDSFYYENGQYIVNTSRTLDGVTYYFDANGVSNIAPPSSAYSQTDYSTATAAPAPSKPEPSYEESSEEPEPEPSYEESSEEPEPEPEPSYEESSEEVSEPESSVEESSKEESEVSKEPEKPKFVTLTEGNMDETIADAKITEIQQTLAKLGYYTYEVTGYYGEATTAAVKDFQAKAGIEVTGNVDEATWNAIFADSAPVKYNSYKSGDYDEEQTGIKDIQDKLVALSYLTAGEYEEGKFDGNTVIAMQLFQSANGIEATGEADFNSQLVLFSGSAVENPNAGAVIYGMSGSAVTKLQERLKALRYTTDESTGIFDDATLKAVNAYQKNAGLEVSNSLSAEELKVLYSDKAVKSEDYDNLQVGYNGSDVKSLEGDLTKLGYYEGSIKGEFNDELETAVQDYQKENKLEANGVADDTVRNSITKSIARQGSENAQCIITDTASVANEAMSGLATSKTEKLSLEKEQSDNHLSNVRNMLYILLGLILVLSVSVVAAMVRSKKRMTKAMKKAVAQRHANDNIRKF
jgi:peptidoglycan hydrolase-like protein with peptidoglycan-binding domain